MSRATVDVALGWARLDVEMERSRRVWPAAKRPTARKIATVRGALRVRMPRLRGRLPIFWARCSYRRAVALAPTHELSSRSLFHALWNVGRAGDVDAEEQAIAEIRRFTSLAESEWYDRIIAELHQKRNLLWPETEDDEENSEEDS